MNKKIILSLIIISNLNSSELDLGIGVGEMNYPDYLGSNHSNSIVIPFPFIDYKSKKLDIDQNGIKKQLFSINELSLRLSINGSLPVTSSGAREGMSNLDPSGEIGPALVYTLYHKQGLVIKLDFPIRVIMSTNFKTNITYRGYKSDPKIALDYKFNNYLFQFQTGGVWGDSKFNKYIYNVDNSSVTENRKRYKAKAGYIGYKTSIGLSKKLKKIWIGGFIRYYDLTGAVSKNSPLKEENSALYSGLFVAYLFDKSLSNKVKKWIEQ